MGKVVFFSLPILIFISVIIYIVRETKSVGTTGGDGGTKYQPKNLWFKRLGEDIGEMLGIIAPIAIMILVGIGLGFLILAWVTPDTAKIKVPTKTMMAENGEIVLLGK